MAFLTSLSGKKSPNKNKSLKIEKQLKQLNRIPDIAYLHIPKTGGTSIAKFAKQVEKKGCRFPLIFPHGWRAADIVKAYPDIRLCFLLRDPIDRMISGFNSRMRMGRPTYAGSWSPGEAAAFSFFETPFQFLEALVGDDERLKSAAFFAMENITHLKWNYAFYFKDEATIDTIRKNFFIVNDINESDVFLSRLCEAAGIDASLIAAHFGREHVSPRGSGRLAPETRAALRPHLALEYRIYDALSQSAAAPSAVRSAS